MEENGEATFYVSQTDSMKGRKLVKRGKQGLGKNWQGIGRYR